MMKNILSDQEKRNLRNKAKAELEQLELRLSDKDVIQMLDDFKNKFNICETVYKVVLAEHQKQKDGKTKIDNKKLKINMNQVYAALKFAGYSFDEERLNELFGASSKTGKKVTLGASTRKVETVKKLRDAVTHGIDLKAVAEITNRKEELFGYMDDFLTGIRNRDNGAV